MKNSHKKGAVRKFFQYDGDFYSYTGKVFDLMLVSLFWLLGCLPVITIGVSCAALYAAVTKSVRLDQGTVSGQFLKAFRRNLKDGILLGLIYEVIGFILLLNIGIVSAKMPGLAGLFLIVLYAALLVFLVICLNYAFPALSKFEMPAGWFVKLAGYMAVRHLPVSLLLFAMTAGAYFAVYAVPAAVLILPGLLACVSSMMIEPLLEKHMPE